MDSAAYADVVKGVTLMVICLLSFSIRLFSVVKYESVIHGTRFSVCLLQCRRFPIAVRRHADVVAVQSSILTSITGSPSFSQRKVSMKCGTGSTPEPGTRSAEWWGARCTRCALEHEAVQHALPARVRPLMQHVQSTVVHVQGLIWTAGTMYKVLHALNIPIHVQEVRNAGTSREVSASRAAVS
jgi:hypothetical protein